MLNLLILLSVVCGVLCAYCIYLKTKKRPFSKDAQTLLRELLSGTAVVKIEVIDKDAIYLKSPRDL